MTYTIEITEEQLKALNEGNPITVTPPKPKELWQPKEGEFYVHTTGIIDQSENLSEYIKDFSAYFDNMKQAKEALKQMRFTNRLRKYVQEFYPNWKLDWNDGKQLK